MSENSMNPNHRGRYGLVLMGIILGALFWILEAGAHVMIFRDTGFWVQVYRPEAHEAWMRFIVVVMFIGFGVYSQWAVASRRSVEAALRLANIELTQIFETGADGMRVVDKEFNVLRANETFSSLSGRDNREMIGEKCYEVLRGSLCRTADCPMIRIFNGEERVESDDEKMRKDGSGVPCIVTATPFRSPDGTLIGIVESFKDISDRKKYEKRLIESSERLRELTSHLQTIREDERAHVAREIHDELGQALTALKMDLHWLIPRLSGNEEILMNKMKSMSNRIDATVQSVKRISSELRPCLLDDFGISAAIEWQTEEFEGRTSIPCETLSEPEDIVLDQDCSIAVFRICQEALTNIARHANATKVQVTLKKNSDSVVLRIQDNGIGINDDHKTDPKSYGLTGMRERANALGGNFSISGDLNGGTTVEVRIPIARAQEA